MLPVLLLPNFEAQRGDDFLLMTQNIDPLHYLVASKNVLPMHGQLMEARCIETGKVILWKQYLTMHTPDPEIPTRRGRLKRNMIWFGEMPVMMHEIQEAAQNADLFVAIGTSAVVYPAAVIVGETPATCQRVKINLEATPQSNASTETSRGPASIVVPKILNCL